MGSSVVPAPRCRNQPVRSRKHVWIVDADGHFVAKFTNDGEELVLMLGTPGEPGEATPTSGVPRFSRSWMRTRCISPTATTTPA